MTSNRIVVRGVPYQLGSQIGHGLHSLVYSGIDLRTGRSVAIKVINFMHGNLSVRADTVSRRQSFWKELQTLLYLQPLNPMVIRVFNYDHNSQYGVVVMERGTTFRDTMVAYARDNTPMPVPLIKLFWSQMVEAIYYMHEIGIVHGDCKPENFIQVGPDGSTLRLIDMGISFQLPPDVTSYLRTAAGTPDYVSPEMVNTRVGSSAYSKCGYKSDIWALGVILFEMAFGFRPLQALGSNQTKLRFLGSLRRDLTIPDHPDKQLRRVLKGCLRSNPRRRFNIEQVLTHPFITG